MYLKQFSLIVLIGALTIHANAQTSWEKNRDSLLHALTGMKEDTNKVMTMLRLGVAYLGNQPDSAIYYAKAFSSLSKKIQYPTGLANGLSMQAVVLSNQNKKEEALAMDREAIEVAEKAHLKRPLAHVYNNTAAIYNDIQDYPNALDYYLKAESIYENISDSASMAMIYGNIAWIYNDLGEYKNEYSYALKGVLLSRRLSERRGYGTSLMNLGGSLVNLKNYDSALVVLNQAKSYMKESNDKQEEVNVLTNIYLADEALGKFDLLKTNADELMSLSVSMKDSTGICFASLGLAKYYSYHKNFAEATHYIHNAIDIAEKNNLGILKSIYREAGEIEFSKGNLSGYHKYNNLTDSLTEIIWSDKVLKNTKEQEAKYSLNKKQGEIDMLNKEQKIQQLLLKSRNTMNWILTSLVIVTLLIVFLYNRNQQQKRKLLIANTLLQEHRINELEKEKQLLAAQAVLQGQVEERTRLAKDLHDGLGGILSSAKYSFSNMKENMIITAEHAAAFERSMGMLDKSISELRRVAHNMMPEALVTFGLDTALKDFCNSIEQTGVIQLTYQSFEINENTISKTTSAAIYRIIQELLNNILKHAHASTALVQLVRKDLALSITVEDNGKGFDPLVLDNSDGIGYLNLKNRITYLNGSIDIQTSEGKGTSVNIEIPNITI